MREHKIDQKDQDCLKDKVFSTLFPHDSYKVRKSKKEKPQFELAYLQNDIKALLTNVGGVNDDPSRQLQINFTTG